MLINAALSKWFHKVLYSLMLGGMALSTLAASPARGSMAAPQLQAQAAGELQAFAPLSASQGWVLLDGRLDWTSDAGATWQDITPSLPASATIYSVTFLDASKGWLLWSDTAGDGSLDLQLSQTSDGGLNWTIRPIQTLSPDDPDNLIENAGMDWLDASTGWVWLKRQTGTNFSYGALFHTTDGGQTWDRQVPPLGGPVRFVDSQNGWMAGGPSNDQLFKTVDAGQVWAAVPLPPGLGTGQVSAIYLPIFDTPSQGLLALVVLQQDVFQARFYSTVTGGQDWTLLSAQDLPPQDSTLPLTGLDSHDLVATVPNDSRILQVAHGQLNPLTNQDGLSASIVDLQMVSLDLGWAKVETSSCDKSSPDSSGSSQITCTSATQLAATADGGLTWSPLSLPANGVKALTRSLTSTSSSLSEVSAAGLANTQILTSQGFDICWIPTKNQLNAWMGDSPYYAMNLYIGGSMRYCDDPNLTAAYVHTARDIGWTFIPTWVGPQAPCTTYRSRINSDVNSAYSQGVSEANLAVDALAALGLTSAERAGSVVYYDLETFVGDQACRNAVKSFMNGWVTQLHLLGNYAGVYGSTLCVNGLNNFLQIANIPDVIWPAIWDHTNYDKYASVFEAGCISSSSWPNHQRIRQYTGAHNETWVSASFGSVTLNIDSDVVDGVVAIPPGGTVQKPSAGFSLSPSSGNVPLTVTFNILNTNYITACSWTFGDGETSASCEASQTHTYTSAGVFTVTLTANGPGGTDTQSHSVTVTQPPPPSQPDLVPFPRPGRSNPLSLDSVPGTSTDGTLYAGQTVYIDWGIKNIGAANATQTFMVDLYIDNQLIMEYPFAGLMAGASAGADDWAVTWSLSGWHTVKLVVDPTNTVPESNESNNTWTGQFYWQSAETTGPIPVAPNGLTSDGKPTYKWYPATQALSYDLYVYSLNSGNLMFSLTGMPVSNCNGTLCSTRSYSTLSGGDYEFKVGAKNIFGIVIFGDWMSFTVPGGGALTAPAGLSPSGTITTLTPTFSWSKVSAASSYDLYVYPAGSTTPVVSAPSIPSSTSCVGSTCSWSPMTILTRGNYQFQVRAANLSGASGYSQSAFYVDADVFTLYLPLLIK